MEEIQDTHLQYELPTRLPTTTGDLFHFIQFRQQQIFLHAYQMSARYDLNLSSILQ